MGSRRTPSFFGTYPSKFLQPIRYILSVFMKRILCALVAAAVVASACGRRYEDDEPRRHAMPVLAPDVRLPVESRIVSARVVAGATLASVLRGCKVAEAEVAEIVSRAASVFDL